MSSGREDAVERARKWLESMKSLPEREGTNEYLALTGLRFDRTEPGHFVCSLAVPKILVVWSHSLPPSPSLSVS